MNRPRDSISVRPTVDWKDLEKGKDYWLTYDFWPHGGTKVRLHKYTPAKEFISHIKGDAAVVSCEKGKLFVLLPGNVVFSVDPKIMSEDEQTDIV